MRGLAVATAFLTRIPVPVRVSDPADLTRALGWFPVVGFGIGTVVGGLLWAGGLVLPPLVAAAGAVGVGMLVTGALHEDGLADTFDGLGGGRDRDSALRIMADSRLGTFGAAALLVALVARIGALAALPGATPLLVLPAAGALGRAAAVAVMGLAPPARPDGLAAGYSRARDGSRCVVGVIVALVLATALLGPAVIPAALACVAVAALVVGWALRRIGGVTGDVLGAVAHLAELAGLVALSVGVPAWPPW